MLFTTQKTEKKSNQVFALDDGAATLRWHKSELNPHLEHPLRLSKKIKMLRYSLLGLKTDFDKKRINYFTMFDLEPYYGETIIQNQFIFSLDVLPSSIYSFYSTALFSIYKIFGIEATAVYINSDSMKIYKEGIEDAYDVFKKSGIGILS